MIYYCTPTLNQHHNLLKWCDAAMSGSLPPDKILIIDNDRREPSRDIDFGYYPVEVIYPDKNLGCGPSWNVFLNYAYEPIQQERLMGDYPPAFGTDTYCIIANDDVFVHHNTIERLISATKDHDFVHGSGHSGNSFSLFLMTYWGYHEYGLFDEMFWPAYFEDNDYHRRIKLAGGDIFSVDDATFDHIGSATVRTFSKQQQLVQDERFRRNEMYYRLKWGGKPHHETYDKPFNGKEERVKRVIREQYGY